MTKKGLISIGLVFLIIVSISFIAIIYFLNFVEPQVIIEASIKPITTEDYKGIEGDEVLSKYKYNIDSFKNFTVRLEFKQPLFIIRDRKINTKSIYGDIDKVLSIDDDRIIVINGGAAWQDNESESMAKYEFENNIFLNNVSEDELVKIFDDLKIEVEWNSILKGDEKRIYYIKDYLNVIDW
jgi:hypothetical protein